MRFENTNAALVLVLVVAAATATGARWAGLSAAVSATACWSFFLTQPYHNIAVTDRSDVVTAVLLMVVTTAITEILWGRRQQTRAHQRQDYLDGILRTAGIVAAGSSHTEGIIEYVADQLVELLGIDDCYFDSDTFGAAPAAVIRDGTVVRRGRDLNIERFGLPTDCEIELRVHHDGITRGRFLLIASTRLVCPSVAQRQVAVALADQVGAALATHHRS